MDINFRSAVLKDLDGVFDIAQGNSFHNIPVESRSEKGFLLSAYTREEYAHFFDLTDLFFVAEVSGEIVGFVFAVNSESISTNEETYFFAKQKIKEPFVLIKQIAIHPKWAGGGIAKLLYRHLFEQCSGERFAVAIVKTPMNTRSAAFHKTMGFVELFDFTPTSDKDGVRRCRGICGRGKFNLLSKE